MFLKRLHAWFDAVQERGRKTWWGLMVLLTLFLLKDRIAGWTNEQIDVGSGAVLLGIRDFLSWSADDTIGLVGLVFTGIVFFIMVAAFIETMYFRRRPASPPLPTPVQSHAMSFPQPPPIMEPQSCHLTIECRPDFYDPLQGVTPKTFQGLLFPPRRCYLILSNATGGVTAVNVSISLTALERQTKKPDDFLSSKKRLADKFRFEDGGTEKNIPVGRPEKIYICSGDFSLVKIEGTPHKFNLEHDVYHLSIRVTAENSSMPYDETVAIWIDNLKQLKMDWPSPQYAALHELWKHLGLGLRND